MNSLTPRTTAAGRGAGSGLPTCDWCDPAMDAARAVAMCGDPAAADRLARELRLESRLRIALRTQRRRPVRHRSAIPWPGLAAAAALLAVLLWWTMRPDPHLPRLDGAAVTAGSVITAQDGGRLAWADGSTVELAPGTRIRIPALDEPEALRLEAGTVRAAVAPRSAGQGFRLATPMAACAVLGTRFSVRVDDAATHLLVDEGRVQLATATASLIAGPGAGGVALTDGSLLELPRPGRVLWQAEALLAGMIAPGTRSPLDEAVALARAPAEQTAVFGVQAQARPLFAWQAAAELRFIYRCEGPVPWMGVWIRSPDPRGPNHYIALPKPQPGRWASARVRLGDIPPLRPAAMPADGAAVSWLQIQAGWAPGAHLLVAGLRLEEP